MGFISNLLFGSDTRDSENARNWQKVNDARGNYAGAQAYQAYYKNLKENDPDKYNQIASAYDMSGIESDSFLDPYAKAQTDAYNDFDQRFKRNKYNEFGNGLIGSLINPVGQVASLGTDILYGAGTGDWSNMGKRDYLSDLGAIGNTALTFTGLGNLARTAPLASKALAGAAMGGAQNAAFNLWENGYDTDMGSLGADALFGAAIGGAIPIAGNALSNATNRGAQRLVNSAVARNGLNMTDDAYQAAVNAAKQGMRGKLTSFGMGAIPQSRMGKIGLTAAGAGLGGFGLTKLLGGGGGDVQPMTEEELAMLYNNYYGGY